jgi:hypothetical protein
MLKFHCLAASLLFLWLPSAFSVPVVTMSASGRYRVVGADTLENTDYTRWAEDMTLQFERFLGIPIPSERRSVIEILLEESGPLSVSCTRNEGVLKRGLVLSRTGKVDYDLIQEGLIRLLLTGMVDRRRREAELPSVIPKIPRWLSVGLARNLDKGQVAMNRKIVEVDGAELTTTPASAVLGWEQLPAGWHGRQALCGLLVAWINSVPEALDRVLERVVRQEAVSPEWLAVAGVQAESVAGMEVQWKEWRQRQGRAIQDFGGLSLDLIDQVKAELPMEFNIPELVCVQPGGVIAARKKWPVAVANGAALKIERLQVVTMGKAPELVAISNLYGRFYEGVVDGTWTPILKWRLSRAESALEQLETLTRSREAYLDEVERDLSGKRLEQKPGASDGLVPELEKSAIESYIDEAEKRYHKP